MRMERLLNMKHSMRFVIFIMLMCYVAASSGMVYAAEPWHVGIVIGTEGFAAKGFDNGEYMRAGLLFDSFPPKGIQPAWFLGALVPVNPLDFSGLMLNIGIELRYIARTAHSSFFVREWKYAPAVSAEMLIDPAGGREVGFVVSAQLVRFWFGESYVSFLGTELVLDSKGLVSGWGASLIRLTAFVH